MARFIKRLQEDKIQC
jgi:hypothetical protein